MNDILSSIKDRISNPLLVSFAIAWSLVNYKFVIAVLSGDTLDARYQIINSTFDTTGKILCNGIGWPLFWSLLYIFVLPFITIRINEYVLKREIKQNEMRDRLRRQVPITEERRDQLQAQINEQREKSQKFKIVMRNWNLQ